MNRLQAEKAEAGAGVLNFFGLNNSDSTVREYVEGAGLVGKTRPLRVWASEVVGEG